MKRNAHFHSSLLPTNVSMGLPCSTKNRRKFHWSKVKEATLDIWRFDKLFVTIMALAGILLGIAALYIFS